MAEHYPKTRFCENTIYWQIFFGKHTGKLSLCIFFIYFAPKCYRAQLKALFNMMTFSLGYHQKYTGQLLRNIAVSAQLFFVMAKNKTCELR